MIVKLLLNFIALKSEIAHNIKNIPCRKALLMITYHDDNLQKRDFPTVSSLQIFNRRLAMEHSSSDLELLD